MKKRVLAIMLACLMLVSVLPMGALAAGKYCPDVHTKGNCEYTKVLTQAPICHVKGSIGYTIYSCNLCGELFAADFVEGDGKGVHTFTTVLDAEGHCSVNTCSTCGHVVEGCPMDDAALKSKKDYFTAASCTSPKTCKLCGKTSGSYEHDFDAEPTKVLSEPNEQTKESGWALYTCNDCGVTETIEILAHDCMEHLSNLIPAKEATCKVNGNIAYYACTWEDGQWGKCQRLFVENKYGVIVEATAAEVFVKGEHNFPLYNAEYEMTVEGMYYDATLDAYVQGSLRIDDATYGLKGAEVTILSNTDGYLYYYEYVGNTQAQLVAVRFEAKKPVSFIANANTNYWVAADDAWSTVITATVREFGKDVTLTRPTCNKQGALEYKCTVCETKVTEVLPVQHKLVVDLDVDATCTTFGYVGYVCTLCGIHDMDVIDPLGHSERPEDAWYTPAGCENDAYYMWACQKCYNYAVEVVPNTKLGHKVVDVLVAATCSEYAYSYSYCAQVDENGNYCCDGDFGVPTNVISTKVQSRVDVNGDGKVDAKDKVDYSITVSEELLYIIEAEIYVSRGFSKTNHAIPAVGVNEIKPTCTTPGERAFWCVPCNTYVRQVLAPVGHVRGEEYTAPATCQGPGVEGNLCKEYETCQYIFIDKKVDFQDVDYYNSYEEAKAAHPYLVEESALKQYQTGDCYITGYYGGQCKSYVVGTDGKTKACGCNALVLIKDVTTGHHTAPENLTNYPVDQTFKFTKAGTYPIAYYSEYYEYSWDNANVWVMLQPQFNNEGKFVGYAFMVMGNGTFEVNVTLTARADFDVTDPINYPFAGKDATCTTDGWTAQYQCEVCDALVWSEGVYGKLYAPETAYDEKDWVVDTENSTATETVYVVKNEDLKALDHPGKVITTAGVKPTCTTGGVSEGYYCSTCGVVVESYAIPALGHTWNNGEDFEVENKHEGYLHRCTVCGVYAVRNYQPLCAHDWVLNTEDRAEASCKPYENAEAGFEYGWYVMDCSLCNASTKIALEQPDHVNKYGVVINRCADVEISKKDERYEDFFKCAKCGDDFSTDRVGSAVHELDYADGKNMIQVAEGPATCTERAYIILDCAHCSFKKTVEIGPKPTGHKLGEPTYVYKDSNNTTIIAAVYNCINCDYEELVSVDAPIFTFEILNAANEEGSITDGSLVKVVVYISGTNDTLWGLKLNIPYSFENLTYVNTVSVSDDFVVYGYDNTVNGEKFVTVAGNAVSNVVVNEKSALCELYFRVNKLDRFNTNSGKDSKGNLLPEAISVGAEVTGEIRTMAGATLPFVALPATANTTVLMELDGVAGTSMGDILAAYKLLLDGKYDARADINKNGMIDTDDLIWMYKFVIGARSYEQIKNVGII